jgi:hypothetical protein
VAQADKTSGSKLSTQPSVGTSRLPAMDWLCEHSQRPNSETLGFDSFDF